MFCHKCGAQIAEGAVFCHKCGTKAVYAGTDLQPSQTSAAASGNINSQGQTANHDISDFKAFVDNHVHTTTQFQSADDLLVNSRPLKFVWICFGIMSVIGSAFGIGGGLTGLLLGFFVFGAFCGYIAVWIASGIIRMRYRSKYSGILKCKISPDELLSFLNGHLKYISPDFHEFGYLEQSGGLLTIIENLASDAFKEVTLCCEFGPKEKSLATICIRPDRTNPDSGGTQYFVNAVRNGVMIDGRAAGFLGHSCLIKTAPILQAAIEYYSKNYKLPKEDDNDVLS